MPDDVHVHRRIQRAESKDGLRVSAYDREVAVAYGVEAMRLVDHFHFRAAWKKAHSTQPLRLQAETQPDDEKAWWRGYYGRENPRYLERKRLQVTRQGGG